MEARFLEAAGGKPVPAGRSGPALFSGPSPRTMAEGAAGTGTFVSGAPGAAALAAAVALLAAALLLAPEAARADECGIANQPVITCGNADYPNGITYGMAGDGNDISRGNGVTLAVPGRSSGPTTITAGALGVGIGAEYTATAGATFNVGGATGGVAHVVNIVQGTNAHTGIDRNNGIYLHGSSNNTHTRATLNVRAGVTIGSASAPMKQHGIFLRPRSSNTSQGRGAAGVTLTSAATIYAFKQGIRVNRTNGGTNDPTTITNTGAIFSGVGNPSATAANYDAYRDNLPHGILGFIGGTQLTGSLVVTNSGDITLGGPYVGILMQNWGAGAMSLDNSGDIGAAAGQTARRGIQFDFEYWDNQSARAVTLTNSGDITASDFGIRLKKLTGGTIALTNRGDITVTGDAAQHLGHAIYLADNLAVDAGRTYAANSGDVTVVNEGALSSKNHALYAIKPASAANADDFDLTNSGAITSEEGDGIRIERPDGTGDMTVDNSGAITAGVNAIYIARILTPATTGTVSVTHSAGALSAGRSGLVVQVASSATAGTVVPRSSSAPQPLIDVAWGSTASSGATARGTTGTAANDDGRFATVGAGNAGAGQVLTFDQEAEGSKASGGVYGGPAGIEAYAISWRDVVEQVAKGDDPGAFADNAAQLAAVPTGATVADNAYVARFRAALENDEIAVAPALLTAIGTSSTTAASDLTDAQLVTFLRVDNAGRRTLLRNVLAQGLTDGEKAILRALATNEGVDAALTAAGHTDDTSDDGDYWSLVKALLDRYNVGDIHVNVHSGSIAASRGDGIRAYYATPHDSNGAIDVTLAAGVGVTADGTGIYVANAGGDVTVESGAAIRAGTDGIRVIKPGTMGDVTITTIAGSSITATAGAGIYPQDNAGHTGDVEVTNAGPITAGTWGIYANRLGAGDVSVTSSSGTVLGRTEPGIFAANKAGETGDLPVEVTGGAVRSEGRNKPAIRAWNRGTGDLTVTLASGTSARSKHAAGVFATLGSAHDLTNQLTITQGGAIEGRTGVTAEVAHGVTAATPTARAAGQQPMIDVTWTGTFSHGTAATVAQNDDGRFAASSVAEVLAFDQEAAAVKALEGSLRYGGAAGVDAQALSWRDVVAQVAKGDDPGAIATSTAQGNLLSTTHADSQRTAILAQFKAALGNADLAVAAAVLTAIDSTATSVSDLSDAEIVTYLSTDDDATRALLRNVLAQGLSDKEKAVLRAVATNDGLATALADADAAFSTAYKNAVNALLNQYNVGDIRVTMNSGSITATRGDGIRAYYATPNTNNGDIEVTVGAGARVSAGKAGVYAANAGGAIEVTVAAGASVSGGTAGIYVANAGGGGLTLARKYTYGFAMGQGATADQAIAVAYNGTSLLDQVVTVAGTVTGGTDAGVRLSGGAVIVMADGSVRAGSSGVGIKADGPALVYVDGEVRGGAGGAAAVHLSGGGDVTVGLDGRVRASGATNAIQRDGTVGTTTLSLITDSSRLTGMVPYRDDLLAQVEGSLPGIDSARLREYANGVPTGYSLTLGFTGDGMLDTSKFPSRPTSYNCAGDDGRCRITRAGTVASRRTGVYAAVPRIGATAASQPLIDVTWTGTFTQGAVSSAAVRLAAASARDVLVADRESSAGKAVEEIVHWGGPAGVEAHALSWREVAEAVAKGDDPGAIADASAQQTAVPTGATASDNAYVAAFRAALGNADLAVASAVWTAIGGSGATSLADVTDAEIVTYLRTDDGPTRVLLRNVLAQGLSEKEEAVLKAVAAGDGAALTTALDDMDAGFSAAYKTAVRALLDRYNVRDIRVAMNGGAIDSRGDGVRAYYATPHDSNGGIEVTIGAGARVTADLAGIYVANAGGAVTVTNRGTVRAGAHGIHVDRLGTGAVSVTNAGTLTAGAHGIHVANAGGAVTVTNAGTVTADTHGIHVANAGGAVSVTNRGTVRAGSSDAYGIHVTDADGDVTVTNSGTVTADTYGIHVDKSESSTGDVTITTTGGAITTTAPDGVGIYPKDDAGHTGAVTVTNGGDVTAPTYGIRVDRLGAGAVTVTNTGGTVLGGSAPGVFAANKEGDASEVRVAVEGGRVRSTGRNSPAVHAWNRGRGGLDLRIDTEARVLSRHAAGVLAVLGTDAGNAAGRVAVVQGGTVEGRTGVYARVVRASAEGETRAAADQPLIDVTWTGAFSHGTEATVAPDDVGRFGAGSALQMLGFDRETVAGKLIADSVRWGAPAGIEAQVLSWRDVAEVVATGDDPGTIADDAARLLVFDPASTDAALRARSEALVEQARAVLDNEEVVVEAGSVLARLIADTIETDGTAGLSDEEIAAYLSDDDPVSRTGLRTFMARGLSEGEKAILAAVAAGDRDGVDDALEEAGFTDDPLDDADYWSRVTALLERYNVGDIRVAMNGGSIVSRGDGIRAYYATPHERNGGIRVTVGKGASVSGALAGVYVANAGRGLRIPKRYAPAAIRALAGNAGAGEDDLVAIGGLDAAGEAIESPWLDQLVSVAGTVRGGTDAAVHLDGGGAVLVLEGGKVHAGSSGVAIRVNDPGPAHMYVAGEVKGAAGGAAAMHLTGGGSVVVVQGGSVQANEAEHAIAGGEGEEAMVSLTLATGATAYQDEVEGQVEGTLEGVAPVVRLREYRDGVPTGYPTGRLTLTRGGMLDTRGLPLSPCPDDQARDAAGECPAPLPDSAIPVTFGAGGLQSREDGIRVWYETDDAGNDGIRVAVPAGASVAGSVRGIHLENAGTGLMLARRYTAGYEKGDKPDELVEVTHGEDEVPLRDQLVTVAGTVTGGTEAAVHLSGGGAVLVLEGGRVHAGSPGVGILVDGEAPGPALVYVDGEVKGAPGGAAVLRLSGGGSVVVGLKGRVETNGAERTITGDGEAVEVVLVVDDVVLSREDAEVAHARMAGTYDPGSVAEVRFREDDDNGVPTGYGRTLPVHRVTGELDTSGLDGGDGRPGGGGGTELTFQCEEAFDQRCRMYEALPSMLLSMNALPSWAERRTAAGDGRGGWARVEASRGKWRAKKASTSGELAYERSGSVGRAGFDFLAGESGRLGVSAHALRGKAEMAGVGEVKLAGIGAGVSATWEAGGFYVDAQAAATWYAADLRSYTHGRLLKKEATGSGHALGLELGRRMEWGEVVVTPRAGLGWSQVDYLDFVDLERAGEEEKRARVSVEEAVSLQGRLGVMVERELGTGRLFGSLDVEQEFSEETEVKVGGTRLETELRPTGVRLGLGGEYAVKEDVVLRATGGWQTHGSGTSGYGGGLEVRIRF